ncbi:hypothetical protein ACHAWX_006885 [Stephanocyclus meneghinianus]
MYDSRIQDHRKGQYAVHPRTVISLVLLLLTRTRAAFVAKPWKLHSIGTTTLLKNKPSHSEYSDFASYDTTCQEEEAQKLAKEFYKELENRQATKSLNIISKLDDRDQMYDVLRSRPSSSDSGGSKIIFSSPSTTIKSSSPNFGFFPSFFHPPPPPTPASAGLFSGRGHTAYSSGRSIRAEMQLLDSSLTKRGGTQSIVGWNDVVQSSRTDQFEQLVKLAAGTLIVLSATYLAIHLSGELAIVFPWEEAVFDPMVDGIVKDGLSRVLVVLGDGVEHVGSVIVGDATWFVGESSAFVGSVGQAVARSMEELVLR